MTACPYCAKEYNGHGYARHLRCCAMEPARYAATRAALDDGAGVIVTQRTYEARAAENVMDRSTLAGQIGLWPAIAAAFGLEYRQHPPGRPAGFTVERAAPAEAPAPPDPDLEQAGEALEEERTAPRALSAYRRSERTGLYRATDAAGREMIVRRVVEVYAIR